MLLGFGLYFHSNSTIPILDASTIDGLTFGISVVKDTFSPVSLEENIEAVAEKTPSLPNRGLLQWSWDNKTFVTGVSVAVLITIITVCCYILSANGTPPPVPPVLPGPDVLALPAFSPPVPPVPHTLPINYAKPHMRHIFITIWFLFTYSINSLDLYYFYGDSIAEALKHCAWNTTSNPVPNLALTIFDLSKVYVQTSKYYLHADFSHVVYVTLKHSYPLEDSQRLFKIADALTQVVADLPQQEALHWNDYSDDQFFNKCLIAANDLHSQDIWKG
jgi:hypothetical protein